jgi:uncharacterized protein YjdB
MTLALAVSLVQLSAQTLPGISYSSWIGNTYGGKNSSTGSPDPSDPADKWIQDYIDCMVVAEDGTCYTTSIWDEAHREYGIYKDGDVLGNEDKNISCGLAGGYTISGTTVTGNGKTITDAGKPTAIAMGRGIYDGKLLVADNGQRKQILIYDVSSAPVIVERLGVEGGIASDFTSSYEFPAAINAPVYPAKNYPPGYYHPLKLWGLTGVGCDNAGRIFVSTSEMGSAIRCFKKVSGQWILDWRVENYFFVDNIGYDEGTDAVEIYGTQEHIKLDLDKTTAGQQWSILGYTLNSYNYPEDPRGIEDIKANGEHMLTSVEMRVVNGTRYLWSHGMTCQPPVIFKFIPNTDIAVPCGMFFDREHRIYDFPLTYPWPPQRPSPNVEETLFWSDLNNDGKYQGNEYTSLQNRFVEGDFYIDKSGNLWQGGHTLKIWKATFETNGNLKYADADIEEITIPELGEIGKLKFQEEYDRLVILTTACRNINGGKMYGIDNWSTGNRTPRFISDIKGPNQSSWTVAGDYAFEVGWETRAKVWVTDLNSGALVGTMIPDASCGGIDRTGWVDIASGIKAFKRVSTGEYLVFVEDDFLSRVILYRWCSGGGCLNGGSVQGVLVSPGSSTIKAGTSMQLTKTFFPVNPNNINVNWSSSSEAVATVDQNGLVKGVSAGVVDITITTQDGGFTSVAQITVEPTFQVKHAQGGIYIDGKIEEGDWVLDNLISKSTGGIQNNEGYFDVLWDENYLYVGVSVKDSKVIYSPTINPWDNDAIEIYIDGNQNKGTFYDEFDVQLIQTTGSNAIWSSRAVSGIHKSVSIIDGGYSMEFAIPWSVINASVTAGSGIGFDISYDDNDTGSRDGSTTWYGDGNNFNNTSNFDDLIFLAGSPTSIAVTGIVLDSTSVSILVGNNRQIKASVSPINAANNSIVWSTSNASVANVSQTGLISAISPGESTVFAKTIDGNFQATCLVNSKSIITSNDEDVGGNVNVYPNPVTEDKIYLSGVSGSVSIKITDINGKSISVTKVIANGILEIEDLNLKSGLYFLSINDDKDVFKILIK